MFLKVHLEDEHIRKAKKILEKTLKLGCYPTRYSKHILQTDSVDLV